MVAAVAAIVGIGGPAGGYGLAREACSLTDSRVTESSGVAAASWGDDVIWTHNDSGDQARFFAVDTSTCAVRAVYNVAGAGAVDWEDMVRSGTTLHLGDIGDNDAERASVTVYDIPEPARDVPSGAIAPLGARVLTYPDGRRDAESLFVDPTTNRLAIVGKAATGEAGVYLAPPRGNGVMERVAGVPVTNATGADARDDRVVVRNYVSAFEWAIIPGETLATAFGRVPTPVLIPITAQGEAVSYARDGSGIWTTSEQRGGDGPVHFVPADKPSAALETPPAASPGRTSGDGDSALGPRLAIGAAIALPALLILRTVRRHGGTVAG